ncbi:MAG: shikimate kinase, partial [Mangrovibacterium sp.]
MLIYLIGYMGSGKTTLGRQLASRTGRVFLDLDGYIEKKYGKNVPEIFREEGEAAFREKEHICLREVSAKEN